jgi:hypothetical protein
MTLSIKTLPIPFNGTAETTVARYGYANYLFILPGCCKTDSTIWSNALPFAEPAGTRQRAAVLILRRSRQWRLPAHACLGKTHNHAG